MEDNWFDNGYEALIQEAHERLKISKNDIKQVYSFLQDIGLIDYDIEKEIFFERHYDDEEDHEEVFEALQSPIGRVIE